MTLTPAGSGFMRSFWLKNSNTAHNLMLLNTYKLHNKKFLTLVYLKTLWQNLKLKSKIKYDNSSFKMLWSSWIYKVFFNHERSKDLTLPVIFLEFKGPKNRIRQIITHDAIFQYLSQFWTDLKNSKCRRILAFCTLNHILQQKSKIPILRLEKCRNVLFELPSPSWFMAPFLSYAIIYKHRPTHFYYKRLAEIPDVARESVPKIN